MSAAVNIHSLLHFPRKTRIKRAEVTLKSFDIGRRSEWLGSIKPLFSLAFGDFGFSLKQIFPIKLFFPSDWVVPGCGKWYEHSGKREAKGDYIVAVCPVGRELVKSLEPVSSFIEPLQVRKAAFRVFITYLELLRFKGCAVRDGL